MVSRGLIRFDRGLYDKYNIYWKGVVVLEDCKSLLKLIKYMY